MTDTWNYRAPWESPDQEIPTDWVWERLRNRRNSLLTACDFRMVPDAPWDREAWESYRQALRDLPDQTTDPREAAWPTPPE